MTVFTQQHLPWIRVIRGSVTNFGAGEDSIDVTLAEPLNDNFATKAFIRISGVIPAASGPAAGAAAGRNNDDLGATPVIVDKNTIRFTRESTGVDEDVRIDWVIWEDIGPAGHAHEFFVRTFSTVKDGADGEGYALEGAELTRDIAISDATDIDNCVPFLAGVRSDDTGQQWDRAAVRLECDDFGGGDVMRMTREDSTGVVIAVSSAVEFTGSAWTITKATHAFSAGATNETETVSVTWANTFIVSSFSTDTAVNQEISCIVWPGSDGTTVRFRIGALTSSANCVAYLVESASISVTSVDSVTGSGTDHPAGGASPQEITTTLASPIVDARHADVIATANTAAGASAYAQPFWLYMLTDRETITWWRSRHGNVSEWAFQVIDFTNGNEINAKPDTVYLARSTDGSVADLITDLSQRLTDISDQTTFGREVSSARGNLTSPRCLEAEVEYSDGEGGTILWHGETTVLETYRLYIEAGTTTAPVVESNALTTDIDGTSTVVNMPSGITSGDLLLCFYAHNTAATVTQTAGPTWTKIDDGAFGTQVQGVVFARVATGGDTLTTGDGEGNACAIVTVRISGHGVTDVSTDITLGVAVGALTANPDPPNCNPGVADNYLWLEYFAADGSNESGSYPSTSYTGVNQTSDAGGDCQVALARRALNASSEDPGTMTMSGADDTRVQTLAIPPAAAPTELKLDQDGATVVSLELPGATPSDDQIFIMASTEDFQETTGAGDAVRSELWAYNRTQDLYAEAWATHAIAVGADTYELEVLAQDGADVPDFVTKMVRVSAALHAQEEHAQDWWKNETVPVFEAHTHVEPMVPVQSSAFGDDGEFAGPVYALTAKGVREARMRSVSPLVNLVFNNPATLVQVAEPAPLVRGTDPDPDTDYTPLGTYLVTAKIPDTVDTARVRIHIKQWEQGGGSPNEVSIKCYSMKRRPVIGGLIIPGNPPEPLDPRFVQADSTTDDTSAGIGHWMGTDRVFDDVLTIQRNNDGESTFMLALEINNSASEGGLTTNLEINAWIIEPESSDKTDGTLPGALTFGG